MRLALLFGLALYLTAASPLLQAIEPDPELQAAETQYRAEGPASALPEFERLLQAYLARGDQGQAAIARRFIGECHWRLGDFEQSRAFLDAALVSSREQGAQSQEAKALNVLGLLDWDEGKFESAIARFAQASSIGKALGDRKLQGAALNNLSLVYDELGDYERSLRGYQEVLSIYSGSDFPRGEGDTLGNIGGVHLLLGRYEEAVAHYRRALKISEELGSIPAMSQDHGNLGLAYAGLGQTALALEHLQRALELARQAELRQEEGFWLRGIGNVQIDSGHYDSGLESHRAALAIYREDGADPLLLDALHDMGQLLLALGDPAGAEQHFNEAQSLAQAMGMPRAMTLNQLALGDIQYRHRRLEDAAGLFEQALAGAQASGMRQVEALSLIRLSSVNSEQGEVEQAQDVARQALDIARAIQARPLECEALLQLAEGLRRADRHFEALEAYAAAHEIGSELANPDLLWRILYGRALSQASLGERQAAIGALREAVGHIESVRSRLREDRYRAGYLQDKQQVYVELVQLQLEAGEASEAFSTAERLRSWAFAEQAGTADRHDWTDAQRASETAMRERIRQLQRVLDIEVNQPVVEQRQRAMASYSQELALAESRYQAFLDDMNSVRAGGRAEPVGAERARSMLSGHEALIEYVVGPERVMVFVLRPDWIRARAVPLSRIDLYARLELLRDLLQEQDHERWQRPAARLAESLIEPVRDEGWLDGVRHLYLVPHGLLNYLPFNLLPIDQEEGQQLLVDRFSISYLPTASVLNRSGVSANAERNLLTMAPARSRLRFAPLEATALADLFSPNARSLTGTEATETAFRQFAGDYRMLHFATHGYFNKLNPLLSGVELEADGHNDGLLEVHEILRLRLNSELVTLSACQTGMGSGFFAEVPAGDEFVGMTRAFLQAGSGSVLATLWEVNDRSTVDLMTSFYTRLEETGAHGDKAVALADAQRALRASEQFKHPYYWAPFVLVGPVQERQGVRG